MEEQVNLHSRDLRWPWAQRAQTRIAELTAQCKMMADRPDLAANARRLAQEACVCLNLATSALQSRHPVWLRGACVDRVETSMNAATCLLFRIMPDEELAGRIPEITAAVRAALPEGDPRRAAVEAILVRLKNPRDPLSASDRENLISALNSSYAEVEREYVRIRSFRNIVWCVAAVLAVIAAGVGLFGLLGKQLVPMCFYPPGMTACPTGGTSTPGDYLIIELFGLIGAAIAAASSLRNIQGTSTPYGVPVALAFLKLPTGALTALLGLLLMRGDFVPGLSALDSPQQIVAWAVVFGFSQQLVTRLVDERGQAVLNDVAASGQPMSQDSGRALTALARVAGNGGTPGLRGDD